MRTTIGVAMVLCLVMPAMGQAWTEDFNDGGNFPWAIDDLLGNSAVTGWDYNYNIIDGTDPRGNFSSGDGGAAHVDTDVRPESGSGPYNIAIVSPSFVVPADATLDYVLNFQVVSVDAEFAHIEINDGSGWVSLMTYSNDTGGMPPSPYTADLALGVAGSHDISAYAGSTAEVRFRYEGDGWDWWMQVDDIAVTPEPTAVALIGLGALALLRRR